MAKENEIRFRTDPKLKEAFECLTTFLDKKTSSDTFGAIVWEWSNYTRIHKKNVYEMKVKELEDIKNGNNLFNEIMILDLEKERDEALEYYQEAEKVWDMLK